MKKGNEYELYIERTEFPGQGIANLNDKKIYVKNALPGQKVKVRITKKKKEYAEGKVTEVIEDVPYKIEPQCLHFGECGGCSHQGVPYEKQLELKKDQVLTLLEEAAIDDFEFLGIESSPKVFEYRNKMEFSFGDYDRGGELALGMHNTKKRFSIKTTEECQIVDADYRLILKTVLNYCNSKELPYYRILSHEGYLRNLVIRKTGITGELLINIVTSSQIQFDFTELKGILLGLDYQGRLKGILHTINDSLADVVQCDSMDILFGEDFITEEILGLKFKISPFSFFQTNSKGAEKLYSIVKEFMGDSRAKTVFDLYCGTGTIGQIAASNAKKVIGVELVEEAVEAANENAKLNGLDNCTFIAGDVAKVINEIKVSPDIIILDPPRAGVHPTALDYVIKFDAKDIIYVSCNPKSLAVDLKILASNGYKVEKVKLMDMFPHTPHIETIVKIIKK